MKLHDLLAYQDIAIQCHNNPDADAIASGFGIYTYLKQHHKNVCFIYSGPNRIQKANLCLMIETLNIPIKYVDSLDMPELLITVDCQHGEGNVEYFEAENIAIIDHHQTAVKPPKLCELRSNLGSCSTIVWDMLRNEDVDVNADKNLITALYYGLLTDTNNFTEISHPLDKDLRDDAIFDRSLITRFRNTNLSLKELVIAGKALQEYYYNDAYQFAVVQAEPCDPNILGMISDLILEVDVVNTCLVYSILPRGIKLSARSCIKEVKACELVQFVTEKIGSGGGHLIKAGGFIPKSNLSCSDEQINHFLIYRLEEYFANTEIIFAEKYTPALCDMKEYKKNSLCLGYVKITDLFPIGTHIHIRTLESDLEVEVEENLYIMIGIYGEVYPIRKDKLNKSYILKNEPYLFHGEYEPTIRDTINGTSISIIPYAKSCISTGNVEIYAKPLEHRVKIFTAWDEEKYMLGCPGDYLAIRKDDLHDVYVISKEIFSETYSPI